MIAVPSPRVKIKPCTTLLKLRQEHNLTRNALGLRVGVMAVTLKEIETGEKIPSATIRNKLCKFFKLTNGQLFPELTERDLNQVYEQRPFPLCLKLKEVRTERGWTQFQLASLCAMVAVPGKEGSRLDSSQLSKFEIGTRLPWRVAIVRLCVILGMEFEELFPELVEAGYLKACEELTQLIAATRSLNAPVIAAAMRNF